MSLETVPSRRPPGPETPLDLESAEDKLEQMRLLWKRYGDCYRVQAASRRAETWVISRPDWVKRILVSNHRNYTKGVGIERVRVLLGNGLMTSEGDQWRRQRRMLQPAFHKPQLQPFLEIFFQQALNFAAQCRQAAQQGRAVNVTEAVSDMTLMAVLQALFSEDLERLHDPQGQLAFRLVSEESQRDLQFAVRFRALGGQVQALIDSRRRENRFPADLLSHCLLARGKADGRPMPDKQIIDEVLTLIVAGHETTAASLNWVWYLLASHPDAFQVLNASLQDFAPDKVPDWETLTNLDEVTHIIKETLRLYPPGWLYTRRARQDDRIGDFDLQAGTDVFINSWLLHRHPGHWDRPDDFIPSRFSADKEGERHRYAYLPFSAGPRHCIGEPFAMAEMIIHLAVTAKQLKPVAHGNPHIALQADVNLRPRDPVYIKFSPTV